jgi:ketosteroid isomerase-like protein
VPRIAPDHKLAGEIAANTDRFSAALTSGDGAGAATVYAEDALLLPPTGAVISGRDAIERFWRSGIEVGLDAVELETLGHGGGGPVLYEYGRYRLLLASATGRPTTEYGAYVVVHIQTTDDGSWRWAVSTFGPRQQQKEET